jgi:Flp pilus assembly protein protease CpaA
VHLVGIAQSLGLFFVVCLATAALLSLAMVALARMEQATVPAAHPGRRRAQHPARDGAPSPLRADRVSSPGGCTYGPKGR